MKFSVQLRYFKVTFVCAFRDDFDAINVRGSNRVQYTTSQGLPSTKLSQWTRVRKGTQR
jgi:hypothetical protein